ncbi:MULTISPECIES: PAQR family membrane homeostasis protein TrhA [Bifidobacterium]|jgi:hemolysin III|uniref:Hemolysin III family protein n=1 Tax=Bifidobacterium tibiigranuli TaxID=2172043 RepID=A0A5N6S8Y2_9BIFI|nr:hemolysin III family protein [Bifidobacterium tibiigranuli]KAE8130184.1 hemolysin III family protein [Bifidobacterium tibiigranuli]KAE8130457.1 hemolysin III family protein [Bifidobacterium tibiigranuli]MCI1210672.1 hemolysin III family protein [Bifidobacterium tibiigranuli]MCI1220770.1 hemolysin III family protein [Bifidobacterium tibiigranuli]MCI1232302.1 hemolysin III family protein [Bifidobacterium tibiigranuli]
MNSPNQLETEDESKRAAVIAAREQATHAKAEAARAKARNRADSVRRMAERRAAAIIARGEAHAARIEGVPVTTRRVRLDVHGRPKPLLRGWIHAVSAPLALAAGIVLICLAHGTGLKWACAIFMSCSAFLFINSAAYHLGDWSPRVTDVLRRIDHLNIFLLIAGTYTPVSFALDSFWRTAIIVGMWSCTFVAMIIHVIWINAPRWLYVIVYIVFGVSGLAFMRLFWLSPAAGPVVVILIAAGGACYIAGAIVYALRKPDPWPRIFGFHEIFHLGTVAGFACHMVAIYMVIVNLW